MTVLAGVDAVLFDVGGVLVLPDPTRIAAVTAHHGRAEVGVGTVIRAHYRGVALPVGLAAEHRGDHWPLRLDHYVACFVDELGVPDDRRGPLGDDLRALFESPAGGLWSWPQTAAVAVLADLAHAGFGLGVVSNADGTIERQLGEAGICQVGAGPGVPVSVIVDSGACGLSKPDPAIFHLALDALGVEPSRALYVGDTPPVDHAGAVAAGLQCVIVDPLGLVARLGDDGVRTVAGVAALTG